MVVVVVSVVIAIVVVEAVVVVEVADVEERHLGEGGGGANATAELLLQVGHVAHRVLAVGVVLAQDLPREARLYIKRIEELTATPVTLISVGAERDETILLRDPFPV